MTDLSHQTGAQLRDLAARDGATWTALRRGGVNHYTWTRVRRGQNMTLRTLERLAGAFGYRVEITFVRDRASVVE
jgi:hypothetical protein